MKQGDLVAWGQEFLSPPGYTSTFLILQPDPVRTNLTVEIFRGADLVRGAYLLGIQRGENR
jgi:hypothetical protein